jgi:hypothetical protein
MEITIAIPTIHVFHEIKVREVVLIDFFYEFLYCLWFESGSHIFIVQENWKKSKPFVIKKSVSIYLSFLNVRFVPFCLGAPFTLAIPTRLELATSTVTG